MHEGNSLKFGGSMDNDKPMNYNYILGFIGQMSRSQQEQINSVLGPLLHSDVSDVSWKRLIGAVFSISKNLRSKGQRIWSPHDQIWAKMQF